MQDDKINNFLVSYAQNREDIILSGFFKDIKNGFYVDVGANDPEKDSVTKLFYDRGWSGVNIEPIKFYYEKLQQQRPRDINLNVGIANNEKALSFREYYRANGLSTFSEKMVNDYDVNPDNNTNKYKDYSVRVYPLKKIFKDYKINKINFLKVDVEGFEYEVLISNDWARYRPQVICVEANHVQEKWNKILTNNNYRLVFFDGLNEYYIDNESPDYVKSFSYTITMLTYPIMSSRIYDLFKKVNNKLERAELINQQLKSQVDSLNYRAAQLARIRNLAKKLIWAIDSAILININNLNKPKIRKIKPLNLNNRDSLRQALQKIKLYDLERYYSIKSNNRITYQLANKSYLFISRKLFRIARSARYVIQQKGIN